MEYYRFDCYEAKLQYGTPERHRNINDVAFLLATDGRLDELVKTQIGEIMSDNFDYDKGKPVIEALTYRHEHSHRTDEERMLRRLLDEVQVDLGSIVIREAVVEISRHGAVVQRFRLTATEGERARIIYYLPDKDLPFQNLHPEPIIAAIEAKF